MMKLTGFSLTDWIFFFSNDEKKKITKLLQHKEEDNFDVSFLMREFITWKLITAYLPIFTFLVALIINLVTINCPTTSFFKILNNGSLPIISFGIITSGVPYIMERLEKEQTDYHLIRRRVMAVALIFMFLTAILYILQTLEVVSTTYNYLSNIIITFLSLCGLVFSLTIGYKMFLLQSDTIQDYGQDVKNNVDNLINNSVTDLD